MVTGISNFLIQVKSMLCAGRGGAEVRVEVVLEGVEVGAMGFGRREFGGDGFGGLQAVAGYHTTVVSSGLMRF